MNERNFINTLTRWSGANFSHLPWRTDRSLYTTLVSEIMLQQTTVPTVLNYYNKFLVTFPDVESLSKASDDEICIAWKGLGYYRRARALRDASRGIVESFAGKIPLERDKLMSIKGIGIYTANALATIGANRRGICVDANLERVLARIFLVSGEKGPVLQKKIYELFERGEILSCLVDGEAGPFNEALMDLGRTVCSATSPKCVSCPVAKFCQAFKQQKVGGFPGEVKKKVEKIFDLHLLRVLVKEKNKILVYRKSEKEWLSGQLEVPTFILKSEDKALKQYPHFEIPAPKVARTFKTSITKYRITNHVVTMTPAQARKVLGGELKYEMRSLGGDKENFATSTMKVIGP